MFFFIENNIAIYCSVQFHTNILTWSSHSHLQNDLSDNVTLSMNKRGILFFSQRVRKLHVGKKNKIPLLFMDRIFFFLSRGKKNLRHENGFASNAVNNAFN